MDGGGIVIDWEVSGSCPGGVYRNSKVGQKIGGIECERRRQGLEARDVEVGRVRYVCMYQKRKEGKLSHPSALNIIIIGAHRYLMSPAYPAIGICMFVKAKQSKAKQSTQRNSAILY